MDYKERMEQMRLDMERRRKEMEERFNRHRSSLNERIAERASFPNRSIPQEKISEEPQSENPQNGEETSLTLLTHFPGLEANTETKIANFEKLVPSYISRLNSPQEKFTKFGYSDSDLSAIINLLASIVEIEFNALLQDHILEWNLIETGRRKPTIGSLLRIYSPDNKGYLFLKKILESEGDNISVSKSAKQFEKILRIRNGSSHTSVISLNQFIQFYNNTYFPFFHETIKAIAAYKLKTKSKNIGSEFNNFDGSEKRPVYRKFSPEIFQKQLEHLFDDNEKKEHNPQICILFTNLDRLALKYYNEINHEDKANDRFVNLPQLILHEFFIPFCQAGTDSGISYVILNTADPAYARLIDNENSWQSYLDILDSFCLNPPEINKLPLTINGESPVSLFIIGGDDVIPMPKVTNPGISQQEILQKTNVLESTLEADWLYSFPSADINVRKDGNLDYEPLAGKKPRFFVSRLPMENGLMESDINNDLGGYFTRASQERSGIDISRFSMVACDSAKKVANAIVDGLPVTPPPTEFSEDCSYGNVFRSPAITVAFNPEHPLPDTIREYLDTLSKTDMLAFVLHGSQFPNAPYYVGQDYERPNEESPVAFTPDLLSLCPAKVLAPICCWGARFINYRREKSTLLSSIYSSTLLFFGSCRSARGTFDYGHNQGQDIALAEKLQRLFLQFLFAGFPAGEALARAKAKYLCCPCGIPTYDLMTVLQFNLFGDPTLRLKPHISVSEIEDSVNENNALVLPDFKAGTFSVNISILAEFDKNDILSRVRNLVDSNLNDIRNRLNKLLPEKYKIDPSSLRKIEKWNSPVMAETYCFKYCPNGNEYQPTFVFTDAAGTIRQVFSTM